MICSRSNALAFAVAISLAAASGCAGRPQPPSPPAASSQAVAPEHPPGNIYWSTSELNLRYPAKIWRTAKLSYWGPDGYYTIPIYCKNGGKITAKAGTPFGDPSQYMHVVYRFKARTAGPDACSLDAVLSITGSPPIAILDLNIVRK
jgi:hypothetical protein